jgi:cellulose synthase/poly-beta-1,6-N-acetylglucosamine synthase-like glycosyltransferase
VGILHILVPTLYGISMAVLLVYALNLYWLSMRLARGERLLPGRPRRDSYERERVWPRVTVQLPVFNEAMVVDRLIDACAGLDYPRRQLEIQVLDDSTDITSHLIAARVERLRREGLDIVHVKRRSRDGYKAGALSNGFRFAGGDFIAVFDADFVPESDFLRRTIPRFDDARVGLVQARWGHLNETQSRLTRIQAFGLDTHFAVEQRVRGAVGCFINFNGTAGVWRRTCIEEARGWSSETLTEDLDLSYRAQLAGWRLQYLHDLEVPAELPAITGAFRSQQFRWAKGSMQTAIRLLPAVWKSAVAMRTKVEGTLHLTAHLVFPFVVLAGLLHGPMVLMKNADAAPGEGFFAVLGVGVFGVAGFFLAQLFAQRSLYPEWHGRLRLFPWFMAGTMGLSISNTWAVWHAVTGRKSSFVRTPKRGSTISAVSDSPSSYVNPRIPGIMWLEMLAFIYSVGFCIAIVAAGQWAAVPFQMLLAWGYGLIVWYSMRDRLSRYHHSTDAAFEGIGRPGYLAPEYLK